MFVSRVGEVQWRRDVPMGATPVGMARYSRDGSTIYYYAWPEDDVEGIRAVPARGGEPRLAVAFDDPAVEGMWYISLSHDRLYVTVWEPAGDIWVADVEVGRLLESTSSRRPGSRGGGGEARRVVWR